MVFRWSVPCLIGLLFLLGCGDSTEDPKTSDDPKNEVKPDPPEDLGPPLKGEPTVAVWNWDETLAAVQKHQGNVVVVHLWASWAESLDNPEDQACGDVLAEKKELLAKCGFGEFMRMKKLHRDDVVAIGLNTDFNGRNGPPEEFQKTVMEFAQKNGANFEHGISTIPDETLQENLEIIGMPAVLVFDKTGDLEHTFYNDLFEDLPPEEQKSFSYRDDVIPAVKKLVEEPYDPPKNDAANTPAGEPQSGISAQLGDWKTAEALLKKNKGRVTVIDFWSTSCPPCLKEFPNLVALHSAHKTDVACMSFNMDYTGSGEPGELKPTIEKLLQSWKADFPNILSTKTDTEIYDQLEFDALPVVFVYDQNGKLQKQFGTTGEFTYEMDVVPFVKSLLEK